MPEPGSLGPYKISLKSGYPENGTDAKGIPFQKWIFILKKEEEEEAISLLDDNMEKKDPNEKGNQIKTLSITFNEKSNVTKIFKNSTEIDVTNSDLSESNIAISKDEHLITWSELNNSYTFPASSGEFGYTISPGYATDTPTITATAIRRCGKTFSTTIPIIKTPEPETDDTVIQLVKTIEFSEEEPAGTLLKVNVTGKLNKNLDACIGVLVSIPNLENGGNIYKSAVIPKNLSVTENSYTLTTSFIFPLPVMLSSPDEINANAYVSYIY